MRLKGEGRGARRKDRRPLCFLSSLVSGLRGGVQTANKILTRGQKHERTGSTKLISTCSVARWLVRWLCLPHPAC